MNVYILKIRVYEQILLDVILHFIEQFNFLEIFSDFGGINLSEKCVNVSFCIVLVSNVSKIRAFYYDMFYSERVVTSMAEWLVFLFQQVAVCYPCVANSESGHDSLLFAVK